MELFCVPQAVSMCESECCYLQGNHNVLAQVVVELELLRVLCVDHHITILYTAWLYSSG